MDTIGRRSACVFLMVFVGLFAAVSTFVGTAASWAATTLLIGTTFIPDPMTNATYVYGATNFYVNPTTLCGTQSCITKPVVTPETFWPFTGLSDPTIDQSILQGTILADQAIRDAMGTGPVVVFGDSQSSSILTHEKLDLAGLSAQDKSQLTFVLVANPNRPNGGLLARFAPWSNPFLGLTASGPTPTDTGINTIDIALQYDGITDLPTYPLNLLADLNVLFGAFLHSSYMTPSSGYTPDELVAAINDPANRQTYGDTTYVTIPAKHLPLVLPLRELGQALGIAAITTPIADLIEPTLKVLVELGYDRSIPYGQPTTFGLFPKLDVPTLVSDLAAAGKAGLNAALADIGATVTASAQTSAAVAAISRVTVRSPGSVNRPAPVTIPSSPLTKAPSPSAATATPAPQASRTEKPAQRGGAATRRSAQRTAPHSD